MYQNNADAARGYHGFRYFYIKVHPDNEKQALQYARRIYSQYSKKEISEDMQIIQLSTLMELFNRPEKTMFRSTLYPDFFFRRFLPGIALYRTA